MEFFSDSESQSPLLLVSCSCSPTVSKFLLLWLLEINILGFLLVKTFCWWNIKCHSLPQQWVVSMQVMITCLPSSLLPSGGTIFSSQYKSLATYYTCPMKLSLLRIMKSSKPTEETGGNKHLIQSRGGANSCLSFVALSSFRSFSSLFQWASILSCPSARRRHLLPHFLLKSFYFYLFYLNLHICPNNRYTEHMAAFTCTTIKCGTWKFVSRCIVYLP